MKKLLKNAQVFVDGSFQKLDLLIEDTLISKIADTIEIENFDGLVFDFKNRVILPGLSDVHVHLREPGFFYKETMKTGTMAAARGGFTNVCSMPNLNPVPDSMENLKVQLDLIESEAVINVYPIGAITVGEDGEKLADMAAMAPYVVGFSDDGRGVQSADMMREAMLEAKRLAKPIIAHCEVNELLNGGYIHDGEYAKEHGHRGICSESEYAQIERDIELIAETGAAYHVCHISTKESVEAIRRAKARRLDITCETAPHYLTMCDTEIGEDGKFKMNPPIRSCEDRDALVAGLLDETVDMIITDHAPHSAEEKSRGLENSAFGVVGLETSFAACYTGLVKTGKMSLEQLVFLMHTAPQDRFEIGTDIEEGEPADLAVFDLEAKFTVNPEEFLSMGRATPFEGHELYGKCLMTICGGEIVWSEGEI